MSLSSDFIPRLVGADLVRLRSQTVYYIFRRIQEAVRLAMT
jgi:cysteine desulfuration protein SufE